MSEEMKKILIWNVAVFSIIIVISILLDRDGGHGYFPIIFFLFGINAQMVLNIVIGAAVSHFKNEELGRKMILLGFWTLLIGWGFCTISIGF